LITVTPGKAANYETEVGAWTGTARFENTFAGYEGLGYTTGLDTPGSSVTLAIAAGSAASYRLDCHVANATGSESSLDVVSLDPQSGNQVGSTRLKVPSTAEWTDWQTIPVSLKLQAGDNLVVFSYGDDSTGSVIVDYVVAPVLA
jgi:hypothetical protein